MKFLVNSSRILFSSSCKSLFWGAEIHEFGANKVVHGSACKNFLWCPQVHSTPSFAYLCLGWDLMPEASNEDHKRPVIWLHHDSSCLGTADVEGCRAAAMRTLNTTASNSLPPLFAEYTFLWIEKFMIAIKKFQVKINHVTWYQYLPTFNWSIAISNLAWELYFCTLEKGRSLWISNWTGECYYICIQLHIMK